MKQLPFFIIIILLFAGYVILLPGIRLYDETIEKYPLSDKIKEIENKPHYTKYEDIPPIYFKALIATEDRRFYKHNGLDLIGSARAVFVNIRSKELKEGGSTLSQQLAKNLYFPLDYTLKRKVAEILMAMKIERDCSKEKILEIYVNKIYYGSGYYGIYDASMGYFHKKPKYMDLKECTILVGIPNAPSVYSPKVNPDLCLKRQDKVLREMLKSRIITQDIYDDVKESGKDWINRF